jgi:hypothetical protein
MQRSFNLLPENLNTALHFLYITGVIKNCRQKEHQPMEG